MNSSESCPMEETDSFSFDLAAYSANYCGNCLFARLLFIAKQCPALLEQAHSLLSAAIKEGRNSKLYCDIFSNKSVSFGSSFEFDKAWVDETERQNHKLLERLETDFAAAKASLIKESIRVAYNDLGHHHSEAGNLQEALRAFTRTRDYTSMPRHTEDMIVNVATVAIDLQRTYLLDNYLSKNVLDSASTPLMRDKFRALSGILCLSQKDFANAARNFAAVESHIAGNFRSVLSGEDVALGAVMCGIAALERAELQALLLENPRFKAVLDLVPALRSLLEHFLAGRYAQVKEALQLLPGSGGALGELRTRVEMDIHMQPHAKDLFAVIQDKLVLQYFKPYNAIRMSRAAEDLYPCPAAGASGEAEREAQLEDLEQHVWRLIDSGKLEARIDAGCAEGSTLRRVPRDERALALQGVQTLARSSLEQTRRAVLRLSLLKHSFSLTRRIPQNQHLSLAHGGHMEMDLE